MRIDILGVGFDDITMEEAVDTALSLMAEHRGAYVVTPNPEIVMLCKDTPALTKAVEEASMVLPDGIGVIYGAKILGTPLKTRVPGIDFAARLMERMSKSTHNRVFLFGAKPGVAELAGEALKARYPGLVIVGTNDGYFSEDAPIIANINQAKPDLLLVCLGAPKQELWMQGNAASLNVGLMAGLGGALDVFAGTVKRAPEGWQKLGLEWLYRLLKEPRRIGRMMKLPVFIIDAAAARIRGKKDAR
jgi:N-acetylglucosaminyldiphosphoundecaprenol N-acetyl-beta-D-mannosaminyltransferase